MFGRERVVGEGLKNMNDSTFGGLPRFFFGEPSPDDPAPAAAADRED